MNFSSSILASSQACLPGSDSKFGPAVAHECRQFDFTLYFEQIFLSLVPSLFLILLFPIRVVAIFRRDVKTLSTPFHGAKIVSLPCVYQEDGEELTFPGCGDSLYWPSICPVGALVPLTSGPHSNFHTGRGVIGCRRGIHLHPVPLRARQIGPSINHHQHISVLLDSI